MLWQDLVFGCFRWHWDDLLYIKVKQDSCQQFTDTVHLVGLHSSAVFSTGTVALQQGGPVIKPATNWGCLHASPLCLRKFPPEISVSSHRAADYSKLPTGVNLNGCSSLQEPCHILATWPGCTWPLVQSQLRLSPASPKPLMDIIDRCINRYLACIRSYCCMVDWLQCASKRRPPSLYAMAYWEFYLTDMNS